MDGLDPEKIEHKNPRFWEDEVKSLCDTLGLSKQQTHLAYIEFKERGERRIPDQQNKLLVAVDALSPSNTDCERGFSAMNNIITDIRNVITTNNAEKQLFGASEQEIKSSAIRRNLAWKGKKSSSLNKWHGSAKHEKG